MARNRKPGEPIAPPTEGPSETSLSTLLRARKFRAAAGADRVAANLLAAGSQVAPDAAAWVGTGSAPDGPSLSLGPSPGALGPFSFGFLNNAEPELGVVVALDITRPTTLPRVGHLGVVIGRRDSLPDVLPLLVARDLGVSWIISVGDGDPTDALEFLNRDRATDAIALALDAGAKAPGLRATLGAKPTVVLGGGALERAVASRAGAHVVTRIGEWLALATWLAADVESGAPVELWVKGGGAAWVAAEAERYGLELPIVTLDDRNPRAAEERLAFYDKGTVVLVGSELTAPSSSRVVLADTRQPEQVSRLLKALAAERARPTDAAPLVTEAADAQLAARVREESDGPLADHDAKRLLKAWGLKVTRQGPTGTPTGAVKLARMIGLPIVLAHGDDERVAETLPEVRRIAALLLELPSTDGTPASVMVRERYSDTPRARVKITQERGVGLTMRIGDVVALLPLDSREAQRLAQASGARRSVDQRVIAELLVRLGAAALAETTALDVELYTGADPTVLRATGTLKKA